MTDRLKAALEGVRAEDSLKENTLAFLKREMGRKDKPENRLSFRRFAVACSVMLCAALAGLFSYNLYFSEAAYIDVDVNPSIELTINRFDRVIGAYAYNDDGTRILSGLSLQHDKTEDAVASLFDAFAQQGYLRSDGLVSVTLQTKDSGQAEQILPELTSHIQTNVASHHGSAQIEVFPVSSEIRDSARQLDLSPAKYLAILELQKVDSTATVESCRGHSISELRGYAQSHGAGHAAGNGAGNTGRQSHHGGRHR